MPKADMEVDTSQQASLQVPIDDDLINYESDAADHAIEHTEEHHSNQDNNQDVEAILDDVIAGKDTEAAEDGDQAHGADHDAAVQDEADVSEAIVDKEDNENDNTLHTDDIDFTTGSAISHPVEPTGQEDVGDEIDYSADIIENDDTVGNNDDGAGGEVVASPEMPLAEAAEAEEAENPEISWEQDDDTAAAEGQATVDDIGANEKDQPDMFAEQQPQVQIEGDIAHEEVSHDVTAGENETVHDQNDGTHEIQGAPNIANEDEEPTQGDHEEAANSHFPSITVQYQGDEFPFFSYSADGFFSDEAVLNDGMQTLLQLFRSQLSSDIAAEDELVFQVDELGLEFSESTTTSLTMHQILEIFDLLVKNDDPDGTRTLYTYLFVRPNLVRRYEFLVESATSGKGLDGVNYVFPQQVSHKNSIVEDGGLMVGSMGLFHGGSPENDAQSNERYSEADLDDIDYSQDDEQYGVSTEFDAAIENVGDVQMNEEREFDPETSATSTLQGDGETAEPSVDADTETAVDNDAEDHLYMEDTGEYAEIDWRDEDEGGGAVLEDTGLAAAKRPRDSDEFELEDEKDIKRRRP